jgi:tRNA-intron endonuclease
MKAELIENKVIITDKKNKDKLFSKGFGENKKNELILNLFEALYLSSKKKLQVILKNKKISSKKILENGILEDKEFYSKSLVYSDLRDKGYQVKSGLKFGFDFRIYPKSKIMSKVHSETGINVVKENKKLSMREISNLTRSAKNIKINAVIAVVDNENEISYYEMNRKLF